MRLQLLQLTILGMIWLLDIAEGADFHEVIISDLMLSKALPT